MPLKRLLLFAALLFSSDVFAQSNLREKIFAAPGDDNAFSIVRTFDGGYAVGGTTNSFGAGGKDVFLMRFDSQQNLLWSKSYGGTQDDYGLFLMQTMDSCLLLTGITRSFGAGSDDALVVKTDKDGNVLWSKAIGGTSNENLLRSIENANGSFTFSGYTASTGSGGGDMLLLSMDADGDTLWTKTYGGSVYDGGICVNHTSDNGYIFSGRVYSYGTGFRDVCLLKTDSVGNVQWFNTYGGIYTEEGMFVLQTLDGGYIVTGATETFTATGIFDVYTVKTDAVGNMQWSKTYSGDMIDASYFILEYPDSSLTILGFTDSYNFQSPRFTSELPPHVLGADSSNVLMFRIDNDGNVIWARAFGGGYLDEAYSVIPSDSGGYVLAAYSESFSNTDSADIYLLNVDSLGNADCHTFPINLTVTDPPTTQLSHSPNIASGLTVTSFAITETLISFTFLDPCEVTGLLEHASTVNDFEMYPNPATEYIVVSSKFGVIKDLRVFDVTGKELLYQEINHQSSIKNQQSTTLNLQSLQNGIYFLCVTEENAGNEEIKMKKFIVMK